jgi:transcriptional regulator with XRE-family HTH domain
MNKKQALGQRIKEFRERKKLTQDNLAELVGIDPKHLSRIENGRNFPSLETLEKLVENLNINFQDLFRVDYVESREFMTNLICAEIKNLSDEKLKFIYKMVKEI